MNFDARSRRTVRAAGVGILRVLVGLLAGIVPLTLRAEPPVAANAVEHTAPTEYCNARFCLHTDLPKEEAALVLKRMDSTLRNASRFFGVPPRDSIEAFVVSRLDQWPAEEFNHPAAGLLIGGVGGGALTKSRDENATHPRSVTVFAAALPEIPEHEVVHAYCLQTFGMTGPTWFKEGVAEMLARGSQPGAAVQCPDEVITYLRGEEPRTLEETVRGDQNFTAPLAASLVSMLERNRESDRPSAVVSMDRWKDEHTDFVQAARQEYHWCWAACHFLNQHPRCSDRFKMMARAYVNGQEVDFGGLYGSAGDRLEFEYRFFLQHLEEGYRVDLCAWDWEDGGRSLKRGQPVRICARRGYQPTGICLSSGDTICYQASGEWQLSEKGASLTAAGNADGVGRLEGVVLDEFTLSEPFELGESGRFSAPAKGRLYLRCRDDWGKISDNRGLVRVSLRKASR